MLRLTLLVLLLANGGYFAWSHGWMASLGWMPQVQSEPHRLQQQVRPDVVHLVEASSPVVAPPQSALSATPPPAPESVLVAPVDALTQVARVDPAICLQAGSFDEEQSKRVEQAVRRLSLPSGSWEMVPTQIAGRWMVYVGKFANEVALEKRRAELRNRKIAYDRAGGQLEPGLSLGRFSTEEAATRELTSMLQQGVRGARVVQERAASTLYTLRLPQVTTAQRSVLQALEPVLLEKPLRRCIE